MSKNNNVNPDHYKVAGRERQGEDTLPERNKAKLTRNRRQQQQKSWEKPPARPRRPAARD